MDRIELHCKPTLADRIRHGYERMLLWCAYNIAGLPRADPPYPKRGIDQFCGFGGSSEGADAIPGTMRFDVENYTIHASPPCIEEE